MVCAMVQATMPHSAPKETFFVRQFVRQNGHYRLSLVGHPDIGLPYGPIPRLLMSWLTGEALKTGNRELVLGNSLSDFMRQIGLIETRPRGGIRGTIIALRKQMRRLFSSTVSCTYSDEQRDSGILMTLVDQ
jgi:hypothetical protein